MHRPVMVAEVLELLAVKEGGIYVDCTVGHGGHARAILERASVRLIGLDWDEEAIRRASENLRDFAPRVTLRREPFSRLGEVLAEEGIAGVEGVLFDLGVCSAHLDEAARGFSYQRPGPLDMRMDRRQAVTAADLVNTLPEEELAWIISRYGEERWAKRIARFLVERRARGHLLTTEELVAVIKDAVPAAARRRDGHPARRTFQALRLAVNRELEHLERGLEQAISACRPGGRVCVLAYHSLEDRIVKNRFAATVKAGGGRLLTKRPLTPGPREVEENPRARSAKLRGLEVLARSGPEAVTA